VLELGPCTAAIMALHRFVPMDTTIITRMLARLTGSTGRIGSWVACLLVRDLGFTAVVAIGVADGVVKAGDAEASVADLTAVEVSTADVVLMDEAALQDAAASRADPLAVDSTVTVQELSMAVVVPTPAAGSTVEAAVGSTAVAATAAATGN